ncbi:MAG: phosphoribosylglycinamide formyltransferase [Candidatus Omnitrophota bacterium]|nr:phosphoribosylglycinamide formyltransferase [Candidatus Omnitrophota bacterium]
MNIAIFASGRGTNFSAVLRAVKRGIIKAKVSLLVCDNPKAPVLNKAKLAKVKIALIKREDCVSKKEFEQKIIAFLKAGSIDLIVLAGFMRILGSELVREYRNRILNIHPALLPSFKGVSAIKDAFLYGVKITGVTVHLVDEEMDHGPIIMQKEVRIEQKDTLEKLEARIHKVEHRIYPQAIKLALEGRLRLIGRKVLLKGVPS